MGDEVSHKLSGEFILKMANGDEHVLPNQFTVIGMQQVLTAAFQQADLTWYMGLCASQPTDSIALSALVEPTVGVNGYQRDALALNSTNWPTIGNINGESYIESREVTFTASGDYDESVNRLFLTDGTYVIAISSPMQEGLHVVDTTFAVNYRLWFR